MKRAVCCKATPGAVTDVKIAPDGKTLEFQSQVSALNECDEYALEEAIALKQAHGGEVTAVTVGPITTMEILYQAIAKGADKMVRVDARVQDPRAASTVLAAALKNLECDLVLTGTQSRDTLSSFVGGAIAEQLGLPFAFSVTQIDKDGPDSIKVRKELGGGRYADVSLSLPAVLCIQTGIRPLTFVPPARLLRARQQRPHSFSLEDIGLTDEATVAQGYTFHSVFPPQRTSQVEFLEGAPPEVAEMILARVKEAL